jgi:hypothetical protein
MGGHLTRIIAPTTTTIVTIAAKLILLCSNPATGRALSVRTVQPRRASRIPSDFQDESSRLGPWRSLCLRSMFEAMTIAIQPMSAKPAPTTKSERISPIKRTSHYIEIFVARRRDKLPDLLPRAETSSFF